VYRMDMSAYSTRDNGYVKAKSSKSLPTLQIPSNVTRISRCFRRKCSDGIFQIVYYHSGVGSNGGILDKIIGGAFGIGIAEASSPMSLDDLAR
jgi:hypothetical protein